MKTLNKKISGSINKKITYSLFLLLTAITTGLTARYADLKEKLRQSETNKQELIVPKFNTGELPSASAQKYYETYVYGSIFKHAALSIEVNGLPEGISMTNCLNETDTDAVPNKPNTLIECKISGMPQNTGDYKVTFSVKADNTKTNTISSLILKVN